MRYHPKLDANQHAIVDGLRRCGAKVLSLAPMGGGVPDLLVFAGGRLFLLEVKDGAKCQSARKLTPAERAFGLAWPVAVVESLPAALAAVGLAPVG